MLEKEELIHLHHSRRL